MYVLMIPLMRLCDGCRRRGVQEEAQEKSRSEMERRAEDSVYAEAVL